MNAEMKNYMLRKFNEYFTLHEYCSEKGKKEFADYHRGVCTGIAESLVTLGIITVGEFNTLISKLDKESQ